MHRLAPVVVVAAIALACASSASSIPVIPKPILGVSGNTARFHSQVGQTSVVDQAFLAWGQGQTWGAPFQVLFKSLGPIPMIHLGTNAKGSRTKQAITPTQIANGQGDSYLSALNAAISQWGLGIYVRPLGEMNNHNVLWHTDAATFRKAFQRIYLIVHGGDLATINSKLKALGMPAYTGSAASNPTPRVRVVWSPLAGGDDPQTYWPGVAYVDVGGADIYREPGSSPPWTKFNAVADFMRSQGKPFAVPEWGLYGIDDSGFVATMCQFLKSHRVETEEFYESKPGSIFDLGNKPQARDGYTSCITPLAAPTPSWAGGPGTATLRTLRLTPSPAAGVGPFDVTFSIQAQLSVPIVHWLVTFGDGTSRSGGGQPPATLVDHRYTSAGAYEATLTVFAAPPYTDDAAKFFTSTTVIVRDASLGNVVPLIQFIATVTSGQPPLSVTFQMDSSRFPHTVQSWAIYFGDGLSNGKSGAPPHFAGHTYTKVGRYVARLVLNTINGETVTLSAPIVVG